MTLALFLLTSLRMALSSASVSLVSFAVCPAESPMRCGKRRRCSGQREERSSACADDDACALLAAPFAGVFRGIPPLRRSGTEPRASACTQRSPPPPPPWPALAASLSLQIAGVQRRGVNQVAYVK